MRAYWPVLLGFPFAIKMLVALLVRNPAIVWVLSSLCQSLDLLSPAPNMGTPRSYWLACRSPFHLSSIA